MWADLKGVCGFFRMAIALFLEALMFCGFCLSISWRPGLPLCLQCRSKLFYEDGPRQINVSKELSGWALGDYSGDAKHFIHRLKIKSDHLLLSRSLKVLKNCDSLKRLVGPYDALLPVPSSLWGRMRGRYDVSYLLVERMSRDFCIPYMKLPVASYMWRTTKQSKSRDRFLSKPPGSQACPPPRQLVEIADMLPRTKETGRLRVLVVDDIVTTGASLLAVSGALANLGIEARVLAVFAAGAFRKEVN